MLRVDEKKEKEGKMNEKKTSDLAKSSRKSFNHWLL